MATASDEYIFYYAADYIQEGYYEQELYFEGDYLEPGYFEGEQVVVEAAAQLEAHAAVTILATVFVPAQADLAAEATQTTTETRIKQLDADFDALFSPNVQVSVRKNAVAILDAVASTETDADLIADIDKTLESIVNLDLQAAKFAGISQTLASQSVFTADSIRIRSTTATLDSELTQTIVFTVDYSANLLAESDASAQPTVFQARTLNFDRPHELIDNTVNEPLRFSTNSKFGTHSLTNTNAADFTVPPVPNFATDFFVSFWYQLPNEDLKTGPLLSHGAIDVNLVGPRQIEIQIAGFDSVGSSTTGFSHETQTLDPNVWYNFQIVQTGSRISYYQDGVRIYTSTQWGSSGLVTLNTNDNLFVNTRFLRQSDNQRIPAFCDELIFKLGYTNLISAADTVVPIQTERFYSDENTVYLFHFEQSVLDDTGFLLSATAAIAAESTVFADSTILYSPQIVLSSSTELDTVTTNQKQLSAQVTAETAVTVTGTRAFALESAFNTQALLSVDANITQDVSADLSASFAQTTEPLRIKQGDIETDAVATALAAVARTGDFLVTLEAFSTIAVVTQKRTGVVVDFESVSQLAAEESRTRSTGADFNSTLTLAATGDRIRFATPLLESEFATAVNELKILGLAATLEANTELSATTNGLFKAASTLEAQATLDVDSVAFNEVPAQLSAEFSLTSTSGNLITAGATLLVSAATATITAREFVFLDELVYEIRGEDRTYRIPSEQRTYTILEEDRIGRIL